MAHHYQHLGILTDLSENSMEQAALIVGPAFIYDLLVHPIALLSARNMLKRWGADTQDHPLAPYVNLEGDLTLGRSEWILSANGRAAGSKGVPW